MQGRAAILAISFGSPKRANGICFNISALISSVNLSVISVEIKPGAMALTVILRDASSFAVVFVNPMTPAFAAT